jgi:ribonuclease BN (tRNA processing enzyme)
MRLIPLGTSACVPNPGDACSGHLVMDDDTAILLDVGPGVLGNLRRHTDFTRLSGIVVSHMHQDHFLDLIPLRCGLKFIGPISGRPVAPVPLHLPPGGIEILAETLNQTPMAPADLGATDAYGALEDVFAMREYTEGEPFQVGGVTVVAHQEVHDVPAWGLRLSAAATLAYSGDTGPCPGLIETARNADVFLCEAGAPFTAEMDTELGGTRCHLTATEAAEAAREAGARQLVLTHFWWEYDRPARLADARNVFGPNVMLAETNHEYACDAVGETSA